MHIERKAAVVAALLLTACSRHEAPAERGDGAASPPASAAAAAPEAAMSEPPAESGLAIKRGVVMAASDRSTFRPCDSQAELWVLDQTDGLLVRTFGSEASTAPLVLYVEAYGERTPADAEGLPEAARAYAGAFVLEEVLYAAAQDAVKGCSAPPGAYVVAARGGEPFWAVEVNEDRIVWRQPEEPKEIAFGAPQTEDAEGAVRYVASGAGREVEVLIEAEPCRDSMSGEFFAYSAKAKLDAREFSGCARVGR
jgi:uncharacterized membrane protein